MKDENEQKTNRSRARGGATLVYIGGVVAVTMLFLSFVMTAFPKDAYFSRVVMTIAGVMVGGSMLAFPYALHNWAITENHRKWATILYYTEMLFIGVNSIVSFVSLLTKYAGYDAPEWVVLYEPFSIAAIIYTIFAWGTVFLLDPEGRRHAQEKQFEEDYEDAIAKQKLEFIHSVEGRAAILRAAQWDIDSRIQKQRGGPVHFGEPPIEVTAEKPFEVKQATLPPLSDLDGDRT